MGAGMSLAKRRLMLNEPHLETAQSDGILTLDTDMRAPLKALRVGFEPVQDLHGYDKPWPGGGGKNLLDIDALLDAPNGNMGGYAFEHILSITVEPNTNYTLSTSYAQSGNVLYFNGATASRHTVKADLPRTQMSDADGILLIGLYNRTGIEEFISKSVTVQLEKGSTATAYEPYSNICPISGWTGCEVKHSGADVSAPTTTPISWADAAGTVYGGTLTWEKDGSVTLTKTHEMITPTSIRGTNAGYAMIRIGPNGYIEANVGICNMLPIWMGTASSIPNGYFKVLNSDGYNRAQANIKISGLSTDEDYNAWLQSLSDAGSPLQICYGLANPVTYTLTPQEALTLLRGENNLWSDANGAISATYWKH